MPIAPQSRSPRILMLTTQPPDPDGTARQVRDHHILAALSDRAEIGVGTTLKDERTPSVGGLAVLGLGIHRVRANASQRHFARGMRRMATSVEAWHRRVKFDAVISCGVDAAPAARRLLKDPSIRHLVDLNELRSSQIEQLSRLPDSATAWITSSLRRAAARGVRRREAGQDTRIDHIAVTGMNQAQRYTRDVSSSMPVCVAPNGVDAQRWRCPVVGGLGQGTQAGTIAFAGDLADPVQADGLGWFVRRVWPHLLDAGLDVSLELAGPNPSRKVWSLESVRGVRVIDTPDPRPFVFSASAIIAPQRVVGGASQAVLRGLASGRPVVATPQAVVDLPLDPDHHALISGRALGFARHLQYLMTHATAALELGEAGRRLAASRYAWRQTLRPLVDAVVPDTPPTEALALRHAA